MSFLLIVLKSTVFQSYMIELEAKVEKNTMFLRFHDKSFFQHHPYTGKGHNYMYCEQAYFFTFSPCYRLLAGRNGKPLSSPAAENHFPNGAPLAAVPPATAEGRWPGGR